MRIPIYDTDCRVAIYDRMGRCVKRFSSSPEGNSIITWDGRDEKGKKVSSGVYFIGLETGVKKETRGITYLAR